MYSYIQPRSLYISQSAFINNRASETFDKSGAAIYFSRYHDDDELSEQYHFLLYIWDSTFINNTSKYTGGAVYISGDWCTLSIHRSTFINNTAGYSAGAIHVTGGNTSLSLTENTFIHNSANRCGALSINKVRDNITEIAHNIFSHNFALSEIDSGGGAMCINGNSSITVHVTNCTFFSNEAKTYGGAIVLYTATTTISGSFFTHNTAGYNGGAVSVNIFHDNCTFTGNALTGHVTIMVEQYLCRTAEIIICLALKCATSQTMLPPTKGEPLPYAGAQWKSHAHICTTTGQESDQILIRVTATSRLMRFF